ncbi:MAG: hypothetical protein IPQ07_38645 [Myxococcales bacterium]|nr:hypothetical protein [Myxococcales bacterium]
MRRFPALREAACARHNSTQPAWPIDVVRARLRIVVHLGGSVAADAIATPLAELPIIPRIWLPALEALCALDPVRAGHLVVDRYGELLREGADPVHLLEFVVAAKEFTTIMRILRVCVPFRFKPAGSGRRSMARGLRAALAVKRPGRFSAHRRIRLPYGRDVGNREPHALLDELSRVRTNAMAGTTHRGRAPLRSEGRRAILLKICTSLHFVGSPALEEPTRGRC